MEIKPVAYFRSPIGGKFGIPRQPGLAPSLKGRVELVPEFRSADSLRGLEEFDFIWLIWEFSLNRGGSPSALTVRPPRLGGNTRLGVFASRSPFRPNRLGLSSARIEHIDAAKGVITVSGADLADGTPIYDIKPYVEYSDSHPGVRSGFVDSVEWNSLDVVFSDKVSDDLSEADMAAIREILAQDPRPQYHNDPERVYGIIYRGRDIRFRVHDGKAEVTEII